MMCALFTYKKTIVSSISYLKCDDCFSNFGWQLEIHEPYLSIVNIKNGFFFWTNRDHGMPVQLVEDNEVLSDTKTWENEK